MLVSKPLSQEDQNLIDSMDNTSGLPVLTCGERIFSPLAESDMDTDDDNRSSAVIPVTKHKILERAYELFDSQDRMDELTKLSGDKKKKKVF